jgi:S-adenosylmethionine hydrolase
MRVITLLSDFGSRDQYVSEMKGTILTVCPSATIVDISHEIEKFNIRMGAFVLAAASSHFPAGSIHVAVVDPDVGGQRRGILIESQRAVYVGPDNGLLLQAALKDGIREVYSIENQSFMKTPVSSTFHGRDVFAYTAARVACGAEPSEVGPRISDPVSANNVESVVSHGRIKCEVLSVDTFGNIATTASEKDLEVAGIQVGRKIIMQTKRRPYNLETVRTYSAAPEGKPVLLIGSHGFLEVAVNKGNAAKRFRVRSGDKLIFARGRGCRS